MEASDVLSMAQVASVVAVVDHGTFSAAADALGYTQSAVSQQVAALERRLGRQVVLRTRPQCVLTPHGAVIIDDLRRLLVEHQRTTERIVQTVEGFTPPIRLASPSSPAMSFLPDALGRMRRHHPRVEVDVLFSDNHVESRRLLIDGRVDAVVMIEPDVLDDGLHRRHLLTDEMTLCVSSRHELARKRGGTVSLAALADAPWILGSSTDADEVLIGQACARARFEPDVTLRCDDLAATFGFISAGVAVSFMSNLALTALRAKGVARLESDPPCDPRVISFATRTPPRDWLPDMHVLADAIESAASLWTGSAVAPSTR
jgi:DNA-binding transcriptional LysR family regulator